MPNMSDQKPFTKSKDDLKRRLDPNTYHITQEKGTEPAFSGGYWNNHDDGMYKCAVCGLELFSSKTKFDSGTGWPSFDQAIPGSVKMVPDDSHGARRTEVVCSRCGAHLGHVFDDGPKDPSIGSGQATGQRFCINSASLNLDKKS